MRAAVLEAGRTPLQIVDDVSVDALGPRQVLVRVKHCGVCHSDLTIIDSESPGPLPMILGHEAAGIVEAVGPGVRTVAPGDHAILVAVAPCGLCYWCVRGEPTSCQEARSFMSGALPDGTIALSRKEQPVYRGLGVGGFGEYVVTTDNAVVRVDPDLPLDLASVIGCAIQTGVGAVFNTAKVEPGATVLVMGLGGIGMSVVQGARLAGASRIIVTDLLAERREAAAQFGATDVIDPATNDLVATTEQSHPGHRCRLRLRCRRKRTAGRSRDSRHPDRRHHGLRRSAECGPGRDDRPGRALPCAGKEAARLPLWRWQCAPGDPQARLPVATGRARSSRHGVIFPAPRRRQPRP